MSSCDRARELLGFAADKEASVLTLIFFVAVKWSSLLSCGTKQKGANDWLVIIWQIMVQCGGGQYSGQVVREHFISIHAFSPNEFITQISHCIKMIELRLSASDQ